LSHPVALTEPHLPCNMFNLSDMLTTAILACVVAVGCLLPIASGAEFEKDVLPILNSYCVKCHGETTSMGNLDLRTPASMQKGGGKGPALVRGSAEQSLIYQRIIDKSMPMGEKKVSDAEAGVIRDWIDAGAPWEKSENPTVTAKERQLHWAFRPLQPSATPGVSKTGWSRTAVDAFILNRLEKKGIQPASAADRVTLLRRVYLDLIGLPPAPQEQKAFLTDKSPDAYDRLVEGLLSRPQYGERWARHWLDVARYAESNGYERDGVKPHAWRYRDYVIDAFNKDKPYDRFVTEQLAGDEMEGSNAETQIATTFLRLGTWDDEPAELVKDRYDQLDDLVGTTATAFLGLTLRCARCHDHKFEPFTQKDYYRMLAVFEPLKRPQTDRKYNKFGVLIAHPKELDRFVGTEAEIAAYHTATAAADTEVLLLEREIENLQNTVVKRLLTNKEKKNSWSTVSALELTQTILAFRSEPDARSKEQKELVEKFNGGLEQEIRMQATEDERSQWDGWKKRIEEINRARPKEPPRAYIWYEDNPLPPPSHVLQRGEPGSPGEVVQPGVPAVLTRVDLPPPTPSKRSAGRRLWLARWMTSPDNPLLARVLVNRLWQWHFGDGLVTTPNDFGVMGQPPSNQELLDYLASEFMQSGWSIKHLQRLIVKSSAFQMSSNWSERAAKIDPEDTLLWRWKPRRLEAEVIRDSMLTVAGQINLETGGPSIFPPIPASVMEASLSKRWPSGWGKSDERQSARRSIYIFVKRAMAVPELEVLDTPDTTFSCEKRLVSTTGPQALMFMNGDFVQQQARRLAARLEREDDSDERGRISKAFELVLSRRPGDQEVIAAREFLAAQQRQIETEAKVARKDAGDSRHLALEAFCAVLLNTNEFFYLN
jgi:hypothetical protein